MGRIVLDLLFYKQIFIINRLWYNYRKNCLVEDKIKVGSVCNGVFWRFFSAGKGRDK